MLICRCVLEALDNWLTQDGHERILPSAVTLKGELLDVRNEINSMYDQGKLNELWQAKVLNSVSDLKTAIQQAYSHAYTASEEYDDGDHQAASEHIHQCHDYIKNAISNILMHR